MPFLLPRSLPRPCPRCHPGGFVAPTPIQAGAIPPSCKVDLLGAAQTGSGKRRLQTALAAAAAAQRHRRPAPGAPPVAVPTANWLRRWAKLQPGTAPAANRSRSPSCLAAYPSTRRCWACAVAGADIVVATPGRLLDLVDHNALRLSAVAHLVLDEADRLLDLGFAENCSACWRCCPPGGKTTCFSRPPFPLQCRRWPMAFFRTRAGRGAPPRQRALPSNNAPLRWMSSRRTRLLRHLVKEHDVARAGVCGHAVRG